MGPGCLVRPWAAARPRAVRATSFARRVGSKPGQAPPPPAGTAAWPAGFAAASNRARLVAVSGPLARPPAIAAARPRIWRPARALRTLRRPPHRRCFRLSLGNFACNSLTPAFRGSMKCLEFQRLHADA